MADWWVPTAFRVTADTYEDALGSVYEELSQMRIPKSTDFWTYDLDDDEDTLLICGEITEETDSPPALQGVQVSGMMTGPCRHTYPVKMVIMFAGQSSMHYRIVEPSTCPECGMPNS